MNEVASPIVEYAINSEANLEIAFETYNAYEEICERVAKTCLTKLKQRLQISLSGDNWLLPDINEKPYLTFLIRNKNWPGETWFGLYDFNDKDRACFAVKSEMDGRLNLYKYVGERFQGQVTGFSWWQRLVPPYNQWDKNWKGLKEVYYADHFLDYVESNIIKMAEAINIYFSKVTLSQKNTNSDNQTDNG